MSSLSKAILEGSLIACTGLAAHSLSRSSSAALDSARLPIGSLLGAYIIDHLNVENDSISSRLVRSAFPALSGSVAANIVIDPIMGYNLKDVAVVIAACSLGQAFSRRFVGGSNG